MAKDLEKFICTSGVVLRLSKPSGFALDSAITELSKTDPPPEVPTFYIEDKGREEANPNDPTYRIAQQAWNGRASRRMFRVMTVTAVEVESVPDGMPTYDSPEFLDMLDGMMIPPDKSSKGRLVQWVEFLAAKDGDDMKNLMDKLLALAGLSSEDVAEAMAGFLGDSLGQADMGASDTQPGEDGDSGVGQEGVLSGATS